ncbi:hypothetical protein PZE06_12020 [Robertmurraya sp. DFI.2.37]|uniref:hypothetical protein n=1 Tax=Robertmurraya sp. DFI.2.37 TaxID=3031819 RepID=UPI0012442DC9|nr:hypothetical protein [Robertmurraya sp. DFI.2.37]MDF1508898.1 hypothetical protein [Robertmurraya sp. DFI.2.37]
MGRIFIKVNDLGEVYFVDYFPFAGGKTEHELLLEGFLIDQMPQPEEGREFIRMWDGSKIYYKYLDTRPTVDEKIEAVRKDLDSAIIELTLLMVLQQEGDK